MCKSSPLLNFCLVAALVFCLGSLPCRAEDHDVAVTDLPKAVTAAIDAKYPGAKLVSAEKDTGHGNPYYKVKIQNGKAWRKVYAREGGKIVKVKLSDND